MRRIKTGKKSINYFITIVLAVTMILAGGITAIVALSENGWKFGNTSAGTKLPVDESASGNDNMFSGTGHVYNLYNGSKYNMDTYGNNTGAAIGTFATGILTDNNGLVLNYKIKVGETVRDAFLVHPWGFTFYPSPDADIIGVDITHYNVNDVRPNFIHFYGRVPGVTSCRMINYSQGGPNIGVMGIERAITVNFEVVPNLDSSDNNLINTGAAQKKGTFSSRNFSFNYAGSFTIPLSSLVNNPNECEILAVGQSEYRNTANGAWGATLMSSNSFVTYPTSYEIAANRGLRYSNKSIAFLFSASGSPKVSLEAVIKHTATGKIDFIAFTMMSSTRTQIQGRFDQAYLRSKGVTGVITVSPYESYYDKSNYPNTVPYHSNNDGMIAPASIASAISRATNPAGYNITIKNSPALVRPYAQNWLTENIAAGAYGYSAALHYFSNNANWGHAPRPKAYANTVNGEVNGTRVTLSAGSGNSANYPIIELQGTKAVRVSAEDFSSTATAADVKKIVGIHSFSYGMINMALVGDSVYVSGGENTPAELGLINLPAEAVLEVRNETKNVNSYITVYFTMNTNAKGGELVQRNNLPISSGRGVERSTTRSDGGIEYIVQNGNPYSSI